jgi:hypothetical protein
MVGFEAINGLVVLLFDAKKQRLAVWLLHTAAR